MAKNTLRKSLSQSGLLQAMRSVFETIPDNKKIPTIPLADHLMSGLAVFGLKFPSLLQFDRGRDDEIIRHNLQTLYGVEQAPCDTYLRERLDAIEPSRYLRKPFTKAFRLLQRGKGLADFTYLDGHYLLSVEGTGYFSSAQLHCENCCAKHHRDGRTTYYPQRLGAVLVHPDHKEVFPDESGTHHRFRFLNSVPLNDANHDLAVNFIEYWETTASGKTQHFSWVSDVMITPDKLRSSMRAGRARWKIENETFNTLKNPGYHFEHNFGHGLLNDVGLPA